MEITASSSQNKLFCSHRRAYFKDTPEERVRLQLLSSLFSLGYPPSLLIVERELAHLPHLQNASGRLPKRRVDAICYTPGTLLPLLLIECKAKRVTAKDVRQLLGYNLYIGARYILLASPEGVNIYSTNNQSHLRLAEIPPFDILLAL